MHAFRLERSAALAIDKGAGRIRKPTCGIAGSCHSLGIEEHRPATTKALEDIVRSSAGADQLGLGRGLKVWPAKGERALEASVLVEHDAWPDQGRPRQVIGQPVSAGPIFGKVQHAR